jgi:inositol 3-alpha-galactosyltransferase
MAIRGAWATLLTRASYLPGVILLHYSLQRVKSAYPLLVYITPSLEDSAVNALNRLGIAVIRIKPLLPLVPVNVIASRFEDTWSKLRVFGFEGYDRIGMIDGDMLLFQNMDDVLTMPLPPGYVASAQTCLCNWTRDPWASDDWRPWNCALTHAQTHGKPPQPSALGLEPPHTYALMNSGLVILTPSRKLGLAIEKFVHESPLVPSFAFPDQDLLGVYFKHKWIALSWDVNAIKTARYWHPKLWTDQGVRNLHYIVDKPWAAPKEKWAVDDMVTHGWWWAVYYEWRTKMQKERDEDIVKECEKWMMGRKGQEGTEGETDVGPVESWEESVEAENQGRPNGHIWPPGPAWNTVIDGVRW